MCPPPHPSGFGGLLFSGETVFLQSLPLRCSIWWWARLGSFFTRFFHHFIYIAHALFLFVDDYMLVQRLDILPISAALISLLVQAFKLPISWRKADLHKEISWIGWTFNFSVGQVKLQQAKRDKLLKLIQELLERPKTSRKLIEKISWPGTLDYAVISNHASVSPSLVRRFVQGTGNILLCRPRFLAYNNFLLKRQFAIYLQASWHSHPSGRQINFHSSSISQHSE